MTWVFLILAILSEVAATLSLRMSSQGAERKWRVATTAGYAAAFVFLTLTLHNGMAVGVAYGIWAAGGVALTTTASRLLWNEPLTKIMALGIGLIMTGVLTVELGAS